ncbi:MAG TPA: DUF2818 family protein [Burkholderiales bacterium]|nr:DUF2818 family protein [Burkholderiales bacterium]
MTGFQPAVWFLLAVAVVAANLPFVLTRLFGFGFVKTGFPGFAWRLLELAVLYLLVTGLGLALESRQGDIYPQTWQFYWINGLLLVVFAFPGFVYRYFWKHASA